MEVIIENTAISSSIQLKLKLSLAKRQTLISNYTKHLKQGSVSNLSILVPDDLSLPSLGGPIAVPAIASLGPGFTSYLSQANKLLQHKIPSRNVPLASHKAGAGLCRSFQQKQAFCVTFW